MHCHLGFGLGGYFMVAVTLRLLLRQHYQKYSELNVHDEGKVKMNRRRIVLIAIAA
jgi:hypothetical protein